MERILEKDMIHYRKKNKIGEYWGKYCIVERIKKQFVNLRVQIYISTFLLLKLYVNIYINIDK